MFVLEAISSYTNSKAPAIKGHSYTRFGLTLLLASGIIAAMIYAYYKASIGPTVRIVQYTDKCGKINPLDYDSCECTTEVYQSDLLDYLNNENLALYIYSMLPARIYNVYPGYTYGLYPLLDAFNKSWPPAHQSDCSFIPVDQHWYTLNSACDTPLIQLNWNNSIAHCWLEYELCVANSLPGGCPNDLSNSDWSKAVFDQCTRNFDNLWSGQMSTNTVNLYLASIYALVRQQLDVPMDSRAIYQYYSGDLPITMASELQVNIISWVVSKYGLGVHAPNVYTMNPFKDIQFPCNLCNALTCTRVESITVAERCLYAVSFAGGFLSFGVLITGLIYGFIFKIFGDNDHKVVDDKNWYYV